jgi:RNA polymerase primary sigma factor
MGVCSNDLPRILKTIQTGEAKINGAKHEIVRGNLRLVAWVAQKYKGGNLDLSDLIQEGNIGLMKAADHFNHRMGVKFSTYAVWWIRQSILQALAEQSRIVRIPLNRIGALNKIEKLFSALEQEFEREPTSEEIAEELDMSPADISDIMSNTSKQLSLDAPIDEEEENKLMDVIEDFEMPAPDSQLQTESLRIEIERALATLEEREAEVIRLYFGLSMEHPLTLEEIGQRFMLTRERVRQIKEKALRRLRHNSRSNLLRKYLG